MHHKIVALDAWNVAIPPSLLQLPEPHTYELISHSTQLTSPEDIRDAVRDATIVATTITPINGATLDASNSPNLQLIVAIATGTDCIDADRAAARGIKVVNCPNCNTETVANHVLAMYFAGRRHLVRVHNTMLRTDEWTRKFSLTFALNDPEGRPPMTCRDETVGIVGYGAIGRRIAELCRALGMNVLIAARKGTSASPDRAPFTQVLTQSTVLVLCVPRGPETLGLISTPELQAMQQHALLLNVSRGGIVDEDALLAALRAGTIGGAVTDVFVKEPSAAGSFWQEGDSPLLKVDADEADALNLVVTPHVAWCSTTTFHNYLQAFKRHVENWCAQSATKRPSPPPWSKNVPEPTAQPPFTVFTVNQRRWIVFLAAFSGMFSPMSSFIFYPAITSIARGLSVTVELVNLAVTTYMVVSGIVPALLGTAADKYGRRPVYILALSLYLVANIGLACQSSFPALLVLRILQSAGSSGTISLGYGVIADITTEEDRGSYVGILLVGPNVAPPIGPILGGIVASKLGWQWIFWMLVILGGFCLALLMIALPETSRAVVGNGSVPPHGIYRSLIPISHGHKGKREAEETIKKKKTTFFNPLASLKILLSFRLSNVLVCNGIAYTVYCCIQASLSSLFIDFYGYHDLEAGLIYIPFGVACLVSTLIWGRILDREYARVAKRHGITLEQAKSKTDPTFPLEAARLQSSFALVGIASVATCGFGWAIQAKTHVAVPLIMQVFVGFTTTGLFVALGALNTDLNTHQSSTASAAANIVRCALAAAFLSALQIMIDHIGPGWCFTIFGIIMSLCGVSLYWQITTGYKRRVQGQQHAQTQPCT